MGAIGDFLNAIRMKPEDEYYDDEEYIEDNVVRAPSYKRPAEDEDRPKKVIQMPRKKAASEAGDVFGIKPVTMEDAKVITQTLLDRKIVLLNLENIDIDLARRILDFAMGSTYALNGVMQKISNTIFIIVPSGIEISGAFQDLIASSEDDD